MVPQMQHGSKIISLLCYTISFIIFSAIRFGADLETYPFNYIEGGILLAIIVSFVAAFVLGISNTRLKWLYPFVALVFAWLVPPLILLPIHHYQSHPSSLDFYLMGTIMFSFFVHIIQLIVSLIGMKLGSWLQKTS